MNKYNIVYILIVAMMLTFSCQRDEISLESVQRKFTLIDVFRNINSPDREATISLLNYQGNFHEAAWSEYTRMTVSCSEGSEICDADKVNVNQFEFTFGEAYEQHMSEEYKSIFGKELNISFAEDGVDGRDFGDINTYVPEVLDVDITGIDETTLSLQNGTVINWNADSQNANGVYIIVEYTPIENERLMEAHPEKQYNFVNVSDSGSYTYSKSDFPDIPDTALVLLRIVRGIVELPEVDGEAVAVYAITHVGGYARAW